MNEIQEVVTETVNAITQLGIDMGIPFDGYNKDIPLSFSIANLQCHVQWAIFVVTLAVGMFNNLVRSCVGSCR